MSIEVNISAWYVAHGVELVQMLQNTGEVIQVRNDWYVPFVANDSQRAVFAVHSGIHSGDKPCTCYVCEKSFSLH